MLRFETRSRFFNGLVNALNPDLPHQNLPRRDFLQILGKEVGNFIPAQVKDLMDTVSLLRRTHRNISGAKYTEAEFQRIFFDSVAQSARGQGTSFWEAVLSIPADSEKQEKDKPQKFFYGQLQYNIPARLQPDTFNYKVPTDFPFFKTGSLLRLKPAVYNKDGLWMKVIQDTVNPSWPSGDWTRQDLYIPFNQLKFLTEKDLLPLKTDVAPSAKRIVVSLKDQKLIAYEGDKVYLETLVSTGRDDLKTIKGKFPIFSKFVSKRMSGNGYEFAGVPYPQYFHTAGLAFHGVYDHNLFGKPVSHGCINMPIEVAKKLFLWTNPPFENVFSEEALHLDVRDSRYKDATRIEIIEESFTPKK